MYIGTHDVQNVSIEIIDDSVLIRCSYLDESTAPRVFVLAYSVKNHSDVYYSVSNDSRCAAALEGMPQGLYKVLVFDIGVDGLPEPWPADGKEVEIRPNNSPDQGFP